MAGVCSTPGCPDFTVYLGRCRRHARLHNRQQHRTTPTKATRTTAERQRRATAVAAHRAKHGDVCLGDTRHPAHPCTDLTADHITPVALGGAPDGPLRVTCRSANSRKAARHR
jgi:hypothetical protein